MPSSLAHGAGGSPEEVKRLIPLEEEKSFKFCLTLLKLVGKDF